MAAYQDFDHVGNATVLNRGRLTNGFFDRGIDAQIERGDLGLGHAAHCISFVQ